MSVIHEVINMSGKTRTPRLRNVPKRKVGDSFKLQSEHCRLRNTQVYTNKMTHITF